MSTNWNTAHTLLQDFTRDKMQCLSLTRGHSQILTEANIP